MRLYNFTMKTFTLLIVIFNYVFLVCSSEYKNNTLDKNIKQDPLRLNRYESYNQYTRWKTDLDTTSSILKVLDEETSTPKTIVGINMQTPESKEKIIVGYSSGSPVFNDYTRFGSLTTEKVDNKNELKELLLEKNLEIQPMVNRYKRDDQYTRWRSDLDATPFIIKVMDEKTSKPKSIVGINMLTPRSKEKIIVGYPVSPTITSGIPVFNDYTRFMPLTTERVDNENELKELLMEKIHMIQPMASKRPKKIQLTSPKPVTLSPITPLYRNRKLLPGLLAYSKITQEPTEIETTEESYDNIATNRRNFEPKSIDTDDDDDDDCGDNINIIDNSEVPNRTTDSFNLIPYRTDSYTDDPSNKHIIIEKLDISSKSGNQESKLGEVDSKTGKQVKFRVEDTKILDRGSKTSDQESKFADQYALTGDQEREIAEQESTSFDQDSKTADLHSHNSWFYEEYDDFERNEPTWNESDVKFDMRTNKIDTNFRKNKMRTQPLKNRSWYFNDKIRNFNIRSGNETCSLIRIRSPLTYNTVWTLPEILTKLRDWAENSPIAKWIDITQNNYTIMDNSIYMIIIDDPRSGQTAEAKDTIMIVAGIHGRDHHAVTATMFILQQLIENNGLYDTLLVSYRFWVIPIFNPDGYDYSVTFPKKRYWVKNLRQTWEECRDQLFCEKCEHFGLRCVLQSCYGVNLDRNFEYQWINSMEENHCHELYAGSRQLSEPETSAFTKFLESKRPPSTFIAIKEGSLFGVLYPRAHTKNPRPNDDLYKKRAQGAATHAHNQRGRTYVAGQTSHFLPLYAGGIEDWIEGHLDVDNTYTIMLDSESPSSPENIEQINEEVFSAFHSLVLQSTNTDPEPEPSRRAYTYKLGKGEPNLSPIPSIIAMSLVLGTLI